jgi:hypothetical protein
VEFHKLILSYSDPSRWMLHDQDRTSSGLPDPLSHGEKLRDMLVKLFEVAAGHAALGTLESDSVQVVKWRYGADALAWIASTYETVWRPQEEALLASHLEPVPERAFEALCANAAVIFFDSAHLEACLDRDALIEFAKTHLDTRERSPGAPAQKLPSAELADELASPLTSLYASLRLDWSHRKGPVGAPGYITWVPQMCICNYWPESANLAPPPPGERPNPAIVQPARAAEIMEEDIYKRFYRRFELFRNVQHALGTADVRQFRTPIFYFAAPTTPPDDPADYLSGPFLKDIQPFAAVNTGVSDPLSEQMSGGVLDGTFLVLRREIEPFRASTVSDFFLLFPSASVIRDWAEIEERFARLTDALAYANFNARDLTVEVLMIIDEAEPDLDQWEARAGVWDSLLDAAAGLIAGLHRELASRERRPSDAFLLVNRLQLALARMQRSIMTSADAVSRRDREVQQALDRVSYSAAGRAGALTFRSLPMLKRLAEMPAEDGSYRLIKEQIARPRLQWRLNEAEAEAERLRRRVESQRVVTAEMLSVERWQDQERADIDQRRLTYGVAVLTLFAVFPLVIGHLDWGALHSALAEAPRALHWTLAVANFTHRWIVGVILIFGCIVTLSLIALVLGQPLLGRRRRRRELTPMRARLGATWETVERRAIPRSDSFDQEDRDVCADLTEIQQWLQREHSSTDTAGRAERLREDIDRFLVRIELLANRPEEFRLPVAIMMLRYYGSSFFADGTSWGPRAPMLATDPEVARALLGAGLSAEAAYQVNAAATSIASSMSIGEFAAALDEAFRGNGSSAPHAGGPAPAVGGPAPAVGAPNGGGPAAVAGGAVAEGGLIPGGGGSVADGGGLLAVAGEAVADGGGRISGEDEPVADGAGPPP